MYKSFHSALTAVLGAAVLTLSGTALAAESKDPIKLTLHDWTGQLITTQIMGEVLKAKGYNVEYVEADYIAQFAGLEEGDLHVAMEMWETTPFRFTGPPANSRGTGSNLSPVTNSGPPCSSTTPIPPLLTSFSSRKVPLSIIWVGLR